MLIRGGTSGHWWCLAVGLAAAAATAGGAARAQTQPAPVAATRTAISRGVAFLRKTQQSEGTWKTNQTGRHAGGVESLVVLAALEAGLPQNDPMIVKALRLIDATEPRRVYVRAIRTMVYARLTGRAYAARLATEAAWLARNQTRSGGWGYGPGHTKTARKPDWTDNCNTQMALLALSDAGDAGEKTPQVVWREAAAYLAKSQRSDGGWAYTAPGVSVLRSSSFGSMTAAATASLVLLTEHLPASIRPSSTRIKRGLTWLRNNYQIDRIPQWGWGDTEYWPYFYLFGLTRVGLVTGAERVDKVDWRAGVAGHLLKTQRPAGNWTHPPAAETDHAGVIRTCFALLALTNTTKSLLISKLIVSGQPDPMVRDVAVLTRGVARRLRWPVTWRKVRASAGASGMMAAPILYIDASGGGALPAEVLSRFRRLRPGENTVLILARPGDARSAGNLRKDLLSALGSETHIAETLNGDHLVFRARYALPAEARPTVVGIGDGVRTRVFMVTSDLKKRLAAGDKSVLDFAANLAILATNGRQPGTAGRGRSADPVRPKPTQWINVARVRHSGGSAACGQALRKLSGVLTDAVSVGVKETSRPLTLGRPVPREMHLLWITGSKDPGFSARQREALKAYVRGGGMVFMDSTAGRAPFTDAALAMLRQTFGAASLVKLDERSSLLTGKFGGGIGTEVGKVALSPAAKRAGKAFELWGVKIGGRIGVVLSPLGVTAPLEGYPVYGGLTLSTDDARRLAANVALYAIAGD